MEKIIIRLEEKKDYGEVENLTREAFWNIYRPGCSEHLVIHNFRNRENFVKELDFVMELNGKIIGHVMYAKSDIDAFDGRKIPVMTFGPISIAPEFKGKGRWHKAFKVFNGKSKRKGSESPCNNR